MNRIPTNKQLPEVQYIYSKEMSPYARKGGSNHAFCTAKEYNGKEGPVAYCAWRSALTRERAFVVNGCTQHPARPPC